MPKRCAICYNEEYDGREFVSIVYCKRCMESDCATLQFIHERAEKERAEGSPAKRIPKALR